MGKSLPPGIFRYAAIVEYDGSDYHGWQRQSSVPSVQSMVEHALSFVANEPVVVTCAGRTDSGVHATGQVIHFDSGAARRGSNWVRGANTNLPGNVRLLWARQMPDSFHARFSALARTYRYVILNRPAKPALGRNSLAWESGTLSVSAMHAAAHTLVGEQDFSAFRAAGCQSHSVNRDVHYLEVFRVGDLVVIEIRANAFLLHMVRNIAGALLAVGRGERNKQWLEALLLGKDRSKAPATAAAAGLYLVAVDYPPEYALLPLEPGPFFVNQKLRGPAAVIRSVKMPPNQQAGRSTGCQTPK